MICSMLKSFKSLMFQGLVAFCHPWCQVLPPEEAEFRLNVTAGSRSVAMGGHRISNNWTNDLEFSFKKKNISIIQYLKRYLESNFNHLQPQIPLQLPFPGWFLLKQVAIGIDTWTIQEAQGWIQVSTIHQLHATCATRGPVRGELPVRWVVPPTPRVPSPKRSWMPPPP